MTRRIGPLRTAIEDFVETSETTERTKGWWELVKERDAAWDAVADDWLEREPLGSVPQTFGLRIDYILYVVFNRELSFRRLKRLAGVEEAPTFKEKIVDFWEDAFETDAIADVIDTVGTFTSEPILQLFEQFTSEDVDNPRAFVRRLHGTMIGLTLAPGIVTSALEAVSLGQIDTPAEVMKSIYWNFGLGFLGWQSIAPMLQAGMGKHLEAYYNDMFRPRRFTAGELRDLYALGEISQERFEKGARELGWPEDDLQLWKQLAFRTLSRGDVTAALKAGLIMPNDYQTRIRALGYDPADFEIIYGLDFRDDIDEAIAITLSTTKRAFREGLMSESEFTTALKDLRRGDREIELLIQLERDEAEHELRGITVAQIRQAWEENVLSDIEAIHWLKVNEFGAAEIEIIMDTWKAVIEPEFRKLNKGTIVGSYIAAVLDRSQAALKLESIGFDPEDARLELDLAEAQNPEVFGLPGPRPPRYIAPGMLANLLEAELITALQMTEKLIEQNYSEDDAALLTQAAVIRAAEEPRPVTDFLIQRAYVMEVLDREQAFARLIELEFSEVDANLILDTVEAEFPSVFAPETIQSLRVPSIGALIEAFRLGILDETEFVIRASELGYDQQAVTMYLALAVRIERKRVKVLSKAEIKKLYNMDIWDMYTALMRMMSMGYTHEDAMLILRTIKSGIEYTQVWKDMLAGLLPVEAAIEGLLGMGFTIDEIEKAFIALEEVAEGD